MTKQILVNCCVEKINNLEFILENDPPEYMFFRDMLEDYDFKSIASIFTIAYTDIVSSVLGATITDKSFNVIAPDVDSFSLLLERYTEFELHILQEYFLKCIADGTIDYVRTGFEETNSIRAKRFINIPLAKDEDDYNGFDDPGDFISEIIKYNSEGKINVPNLIYYYEAYPREMRNAMNIVCKIKQMKLLLPLLGMSKDEMDAAISNAIETGDTSGLRLDISKETIDKNMTDGPKVCKRLAVVKEYAEKVVQARKKEVKNTKKELDIYKEFLEEIKKIGESKEIKGYEQIISKVPDKRLRLEYLRLVLEHNNEEYRKIDLRLKEYKANTSTKYLSLLRTYGIKKDEIDIKLVMRNTLDEVSDMLMFLSKITKNKELRIQGLELSDLETIVNLKELINKGILNEQCLVDNPKLFIKNSDVTVGLNKNIELCKKYNFDIANLSNNPEVLLNNNQLEENLKILDQYEYKFGLVTKVKPTTDCRFLSLTNLNERIDKILELGYEDLLDSDLSLLNEDNWDRIYILKSIGEVPKTKQELLKVLRDKTFIMPDSKISNYIHNAVPYCESDFGIDPCFITDFYNSIRTVNINGIILSKNRILKDDKLSFQSVIRGSILSREEIESIMGELKQKTYELSD